MGEINMLRGHRITFWGTHPVNNKNMIEGRSWPAGHVLPTPDLDQTPNVQSKTKFIVISYNLEILILVYKNRLK